MQNKLTNYELTDYGLIRNSKSAIRQFPRIMLVDMNSFFASVEQQANPFLRGKPLGVSNSRLEASCLIGTSKEAKALGIKNGLPLYKARKIYPKILVVDSEPEKYREVNRQINRIFADYANRIETYSVDESFLDLHEPINRHATNPLIIGSLIKERIKKEVGEWLTCSVGIAPNKFMAKLAADLPPHQNFGVGVYRNDDIGIVWRENLSEIYKHKELSDLWGIGKGWQTRLAKLNITSPLQLLDYPVENLMAMFGKPGFYIWQRVNGLEEDEISNDGDEPKSFGHSWVLNFRTVNKERLKIVILRLAEKASRRMRHKGFVASGLYLSISLVDGTRLHWSKKLQFQIETGLQLYEQAMNISKSWNFASEVMHIAVGFIYLNRKINQLTLFSDKFLNLTNTLDRINNKYGEFTIRSGLLAKTSDFAPDAIAFGK